MSEKSLCQHHTYLLIVRQFTHHLVVLVVHNSKVRQHLVGIALGIPSVHLGKLILQFCHLDTVFLIEILLHIESFALLHVLPERLVSHEHSVPDRVLVIFEVVLFEH